MSTKLYSPPGFSGKKAPALATKPIPAPKNWKELTYHPLAEKCEFGTGVDMDAAVENMKRVGFDPEQPIVLIDQMDGEGVRILDGRHKQDWAKKAGVVPSFALFEGENAFDYIATTKIFRQHLTASQRAMIAATLHNRLKGTNQHTEEAQKCASSMTIANAAQVMQVSDRIVDQAKVVTEHGTEQLQEAVRDGTVRVSDAEKIADLPKAEQNKALADVKAGKANTVAQAAGVTRPPPATPKREPKPVKPGRPLIDWHRVDQALTVVFQLPDDIKNAYPGEQYTEEHYNCSKLLRDFGEELWNWRKRLAGIK